MPTASAANRGALSAADWSTFNTKVGGVTATTPLFSSGGSTPNLTIQQSSGSQDGYLSSTDWTTFNNKQAAGNYITSLTGEATATGPGAAAVTLDNAAVTAKILTGVNITGGTILSTDSILTGFGKLQNQVNGLIGGSIYQGTWNANTNTPTLTSSVGTAGYYYIVSVAGTTNLNGITDWQVGDWAIFNGGVWQKVDNTDSVTSVNGQTGAVSLTTDNISEGVTNLYFTNTRARAALSFVAGSGAYNSSTGAITIPTNTSQLTNGANFITLASLSGTSPISYNSGTGAISITQAGTASNGYLSSTDWNTFNNKQSTITLTTTGTSGAATFSANTLNIPQYQGVLTNPVTGTGSSGRVTYWDSSSSVTSNANFYFDSTYERLRIGTSAFGPSTTTQLLVGDIMLPSSAAIAQFNGFVRIKGNIIIQNAANVTLEGGIECNGSQSLITTASFEAASFIKTGGTSSQFLKADGTVDSTLYVSGSGTANYLPIFTATRVLGNSPISDNSAGQYVAINGRELILDNSRPLRGITTTSAQYRMISIETDDKVHIDGNGLGTIAGASATPIDFKVFGTITQTSVTSSLLKSNSSGTLVAAIAGTDYQTPITLTTTGTSGAATLVGATLNIPQYQSVITNPVTGTGASGRVAYWNGSSSITGSDNFFYDSGNQN